MLIRSNVKSSFAIPASLVNGNLRNLHELIRTIVGSLSELIFKKWEIAYLLMGFLLGRALILNELSPFAVPFFAVMYHLRRDKLLYILLAILLGSNMAHYNNSPTIFSAIIIFVFTQKILKNKSKAEISFTPFIVLFSVLVPKIILQMYLGFEEITPLIMAGVESLLAFVLTLIFVQALPILVYKKERVKLGQEEVIALTIVLASVMTGTLGWSVNGYQIEYILSSYLILVFAYVGGGAVGASVGVITGLILSLANPNAIYQISLLAFSGLLAGLLKQGNKLGVALGLLFGTTILSVYLGNQQDIWKTISESLIALVIFFWTPQKLFKEIAKFIPGTPEYHDHYQDYVTRIRDVTSKKIEQFSKMFSQLALSFNDISVKPNLDQSSQLDHFLGQVSEDHCKTCWKRKKCWDEEFYRSYRLMTELMTVIEMKVELQKRDIPEDWLQHCVKAEQIAFQLVDIYETYGDHLYWKSQIDESRLLVSHQLFGVSQVMKDLAIEIQKESKELGVQEQQIRYSLEKLGLSIRHVNIISLDEGSVEIEVIQPSCPGVEECNKLVAPLISEVVGENIVVSEKHCNNTEEGTCKVCLKTAKTYEIETGLASAAKGGKWLSGDSFSTIEIGNGKFAIALSDGMGNGERAKKESKETLELLQQLLHSGIDEALSIKTINSVLLLRTQEEIFSTIDLAIVDLYSGFTKFLKVGSTPSFIKRGNEVSTVSANNLPVGIISDIDIDIIDHNLMPGDLLIMMTDGLYDTPKSMNNKELWMKRLIQEIDTEDPQEFADLLLEKVIRYGQGEINDDMTVVISRIDRYSPKWSAIKVLGELKIERETMVN